MQQRSIARWHLGKRPQVTLEMGGEELREAAGLKAARSAQRTGKVRGMRWKKRWRKGVLGKSNPQGYGDLIRHGRGRKGTLGDLVLRSAPPRGM